MGLFDIFSKRKTKPNLVPAYAAITRQARNLYAALLLQYLHT